MYRLTEQACQNNRKRNYYYTRDDVESSEEIGNALVVSLERKSSHPHHAALAHTGWITEQTIDHHTPAASSISMQATLVFVH